MNRSLFIEDLSDPSFVNENISTTILVTKLDADFTILEANKEYFKFIGYSKEEMWDLFQNKGYYTLHPDDSGSAAELLLYQSENPADPEFSVTCRILHKDGMYRTALFKGRRAFDANGAPIAYFIIVDITPHAILLQSLEEERDFNSAIAAFANTAFFDYNLATQTLRVSSVFANRIGVPHIIKDYPTAAIKLGTIGAAHHKKMRERFASLGKTSEIVAEEFPVLSLSGETFWYRNEYRVLYDAQKMPVRVVGNLTDISDHHYQINELSAKANRDAATGLLNKATTERSVREYLKLASGTETNALLIIDLDNFKVMNDTLGHAHGDKAIENTAYLLKQLLREDDIIGRIGGDEFAVFMKNCKAPQNVFFKAKEIVKALRQSYENGAATVNISASVGIAFWEGKAQTFEMLYDCADKALYTAKHDGRDGFCIYNRNRVRYD